MLVLQGLDVPAFIAFFILNIENLQRDLTLLELKEEKITFRKAKGAPSRASLALSKNKW